MLNNTLACQQNINIKQSNDKRFDSTLWRNKLYHSGGGGGDDDDQFFIYPGWGIKQSSILTKVYLVLTGDQQRYKFRYYILQMNSTQGKKQALKLQTTVVIDIKFLKHFCWNFICSTVFKISTDKKIFSGQYIVLIYRQKSESKCL